MRVGPYEILDELGRGGMGVVFRARSPGGAEVAIKLLSRATEPAVVARFARERRLQGALGEGDGFVPLLDSGDGPEGPWLVMPFLPGGTLRAKIEKGRLSIPEVVALGRTLGAALGRAHARGIVHRDLKPENVLFDRSGVALVADLGLAKHFRTDAPGASQSVALSVGGETRGTFGYMAPEQMQSAREVGPPADVFSLGALLFECLTGVPAFDGRTISEVVAKVTSGQKPVVRRHRADTPRWLAAVLARALDPYPERRQPDGAAFARAIDEGPARAARRVAQGVLAGLLAASAFAGLGILLARPRSGLAPVPVASVDPATRLLESARVEWARGHGEEALSLCRRAQADAARSEERQAAAALAGDIAFATSAWSAALASYDQARTWGAPGSNAPFEARRQTALVLLGKADLARLGRFPREELLRPPLALACAILEQRALDAAVPLLELGKLDALPAAPGLGPRIGKLWFEEAVHCLDEWSARGLDPGKLDLGPGAELASLAPVVAVYGRAFAADPGIGFFPPELALLFDHLRGVARLGPPNDTPEALATTWAPAFARCPEHPVYLFVRALIEQSRPVAGSEDPLAGKRRALELAARSVAALEALPERPQGARALAENLATSLLDRGLPASERLPALERAARLARSRRGWEPVVAARHEAGDAPGEQAARELMRRDPLIRPDGSEQPGTGSGE